MRPLILWDIDGTLMRGNGAVARLFLQALREVYRLPDEIKRVDYGGKTDGQIVLETLALHDIQHEAALELLPQFNSRYHQLMDDGAHELHQHVRILPGVVPLLLRLREHDVIQTLLTGNMELVAEIKLRALDLQQYFDLPIGAYGSDDRDRTRLVPIARRKAAIQHGERIGPTIVIGDTPRDIACGKAGGARTVAVATGSFTMEQLAEHQPDAVLADLSDTDAALTAILHQS